MKISSLHNLDVYCKIPIILFSLAFTSNISTMPLDHQEQLRCSASCWRCWQFLLTTFAANFWSIGVKIPEGQEVTTYVMEIYIDIYVGNYIYVDTRILVGMNTDSVLALPR